MTLGIAGAFMCMLSDPKNDPPLLGATGLFEKKGQPPSQPFNVEEINPECLLNKCMQGCPAYPAMPDGTSGSCVSYALIWRMERVWKRKKTLDTLGLNFCRQMDRFVLLLLVQAPVS